MDTRQNEIFKAMADPHRRQILGELCRQSREAGELARLVGLAPNAVSFHLRALRAAELVNVRREGRFLRYSLEPHRVASWRQQVDRLFPADLLHAEPLGENARYPLPHDDPADTDTDTAAVAEEPWRGDDQLPTELL